MFGLTYTMNLHLLVSIFPLVSINPGSSVVPFSWTAWRANCQVCQGLITIGGGIFCVNFSSQHGPWSPCHRAWHGDCYCAMDNGEFPIAKPQDEAGEWLPKDSKDHKRFLVARDGDNLVTPFQCDICHFVNIMGWEPLDALASDHRMLKCIRRANSDAFWARESRTVRSVLDEAKRGLATASALGFTPAHFRPRGPFPPIDSMGMGIAIVIV